MNNIRIASHIYISPSIYIDLGIAIEVSNNILFSTNNKYILAGNTTMRFRHGTPSSIKMSTLYSRYLGWLVSHTVISLKDESHNYDI